MEASKVYYTDFRCPVGTSLLDKLRRVCIAAGIKDIDMDGKFVAIKMHFGELGNLAFLRPNYAKVVADLCKEQGGLPFLTDCNTLYPGSRKNALEHLECAQLNGFWPMTTGCQVIIADGLRGTDEAEVPVPNGEYCKTAKIGRAIMDADIFISLTHFKGHESTGFGGTLKNIGMGCGSRAGKMIQHAAGHPEVQQSLCRGCHRCAKECGSDAITYDANNKAVIDQTKCKGCGRCIGACNFDAIYSQCDSANEMLDRKMAEYAAAVCAGRPCFHVSLVQDISPNCDCHCENDAPILPDIGIFASFDPVALDQACADACLNAQPLPNSQLGQNLAKPGWNCHHDNFKDSNPNIEWKATLEQAEKIGIPGLFRKNKKKLTNPVSFFLCWVHWPTAGTQSSSTVCRACQFFRVQPGRVSGSRPASSMRPVMLSLSLKRLSASGSIIVQASAKLSCSSASSVSYQL